MPARALIIAIEDYPDVQGGTFARKLTGTLQAGLDFRSWLIGKWTTEKRPDADTELLFCSEPPQPFGTGATQQDILTALARLRDDGQNQTDEFFFFFSGHGFLFVDKPGARADILISSDFKNATISGYCCLKLDLIVNWLQAHLGPGKHYYFVDACRNSLNGAQIQTSDLIPFDPQGTAEAATFVMQSAVAGAVAPVGGPFPGAVLGGLKGTGRAKVWEGAPPGAMLVRYDTLRRHLKATLPPSSFSSRNLGPNGDGESEAILATISPVKDSRCTVKVTGAPAGQVGQLAITPQSAPPLPARPLVLPGEEIPLPPGDYWMAFQLANAAVTPSGPVAVDLYSDSTVTFDVGPGPPAIMPESPPPGGGRRRRINVPRPQGADAGEVRPAPTAAPSGVALDLAFPSTSRLTLRNLDTGVEVVAVQPKRVEVPRGHYLATLNGPRGEVIKREEIDLTSGMPASLDLGRWDTSVPHRSIAERLPHDPYVVDFSESLGGPIVDSDLDLWLALLGGGRIFGSRGDYSKLSGFPLHDFSAEKPGASPTYLLAGFEDPGTHLRVGLSNSEQVSWQPAIQPPGMPGILEAYLPVRSGNLFSFQIGDELPCTIAGIGIPNRANLVTLTLDEDGTPRISQFLLPLGHLIQELSREVSIRLQGRNHLGDVRFLAQASRAFRKRRDLTSTMHSDELVNLLHGKWLDPIGNSLAAYELLRRGRKDELSDVIPNMKRCFPELPDTWSLARLGGDGGAQPHGIPLFQDGLRAFEGFSNTLPLPASLLDYTSPWTAWRGAVEG